MVTSDARATSNGTSMNSALFISYLQWLDAVFNRDTSANHHSIVLPIYCSVVPELICNRWSGDAYCRVSDEKESSVSIIFKALGNIVAAVV